MATVKLWCWATVMSAITGVPRAADPPLGAQVLYQLFFQHSAGLNEQAAVSDNINWMDTWSLPKARPISCNDCPAFQRPHISIRWFAESFTRLPCVINTTFKRRFVSDGVASTGWPAEILVKYSATPKTITASIVLYELALRPCQQVIKCIDKGVRVDRVAGPFLPWDEDLFLFHLI